MIRISTALLALVVSTLLTPFAAAEQHEETREGGVTGTGIVGTITALGSYVVNGQRITYDPDLEISSTLGMRSPVDLVPGHNIAAAVEWVDDAWRASEIAQVHAIVGPVTEATKSSITVLGSTVLLPEGANAFSQGDWVAVSGHWVGDDVAATKVELIEPREEASLTGSYMAPIDGAELTVGKSRLDGANMTHAKNGDVIRVFGRPLSDGLAVSSISLGHFDQPVGAVLVEGYMSAPDPNGFYTILGTGLSAFTSQPEMVNTAMKDLHCGVGSGLLQSVDVSEPGIAQDLNRLGCAR